MIGSSMPASVITPKYRMAKTNMPATGAIEEMPAIMNLAVVSPNPPIRAATTGIAISATIGASQFSIIVPSSTNTVSAPSAASIFLPGACPALDLVGAEPL
jgi:hypothetical protein